MASPELFYGPALEEARHVGRGLEKLDEILLAADRYAPLRGTPDEAVRLRQAEELLWAMIQDLWALHWTVCLRLAEFDHGRYRLSPPTAANHDSEKGT